MFYINIRRAALSTKYDYINQDFNKTVKLLPTEDFKSRQSPICDLGTIEHELYRIGVWEYVQ